MTMIRRRTFLERLSLGAGAVMLSPMVNALVNEARGQGLNRKRFVIVSEGNGMDFESTFRPVEITNKAPFTLNGGELLELTSFTLPASFAALAPYKSQLLMIDGLANTQHLMGGHWGGYIGFSCVPNTGGTPTSKSENSGGPGGITFDQYLANTIGKNSPFKSVDLGMIGNNKMATPIIKMPFAYGREQPVPVQCSPAQAFARLFLKGGAATDPAGGPVDQKMGELLNSKRRFLFDFVRDDIKRVQANLAGRERAKLDEYLTGIGSLETRLAALANGGGMSCAKGSPLKDAGTEEERLEQMFEIGTLALTCNLTQVLTIASGPANHFSITFRRFTTTDKHGLGHGAEPESRFKIHNFHSDLIRKMVDKLAAAKEGTGSVADSTIVQYTSDNGEQHHARHVRWPVVLVAGKNTGVRTGGRYLRYPTTAKGAPRGPKVRALADLYITLSHALGAPNDQFAKGNLETIKGTLPELA